MSPEELFENMDDVDAFIVAQKQNIIDAETALAISATDFISQRKKESAQNNLISCLKVIDSVLSSANRDKD